MRAARIALAALLLASFPASAEEAPEPERKEKGADRAAAEIRDLADGIEGLVVRVVGDRVVLDGKLLAVRDKERVDLIAKSYPRVLNLVTVDLGTHRETVAEEIRRRVRSADLSLQDAGGKAILRGTVPSEADRTAAEQIARAFYPDVMNQLQVAPEMLEVEVVFARVQASDLRKAGQNLPADLSGVLSGSAGTGQGPEFRASARAALLVNALQSQGKATVLASPRLSTASGSEAVFHSGGEQGYRVAGTGVADVKFKKHGLLLRIRPTLLPDGRMRTSVAVEVSAPVADAAGENPAFTTFTTESEVVAADGEAVLVSGLLESLKSKFRERTPVLGSIPVLKAFFSAERDAGQEARLLLLVTPHRAPLQPASDEAARTLRDARKGP